MPAARQCSIRRFLAKTKSTRSAAQKSEAPSPISSVFPPRSRAASTRAHLQVPLRQPCTLYGEVRFHSRGPACEQVVGDRGQALDAVVLQDGVDRVVEAVAHDLHGDAVLDGRLDERGETVVDAQATKVPFELVLAHVEQGHLPGHADGGTDDARAPVTFEDFPTRTAVAVQ